MEDKKEKNFLISYEANPGILWLITFVCGLIQQILSALWVSSFMLNIRDTAMSKTHYLPQGNCNLAEDKTIWVSATCYLKSFYHLERLNEDKSVQPALDWTSSGSWHLASILIFWSITASHSSPSCTTHFLIACLLGHSRDFNHSRLLPTIIFNFIYLSVFHF